jgi:4-hydroxy-3-methylbut-2-enyl diphosphate reductase
VVADSLHAPDGADPLVLAQANAVADALRRHGREARVGAVACSTSIVHGQARTDLARHGALAVEMESVWLARTSSTTLSSSCGPWATPNATGS